MPNYQQVASSSTGPSRLQLLDGQVSVGPAEPGLPPAALKQLKDCNRLIEKGGGRFDLVLCK
eukprot:8708970-Lingulodinium_polyedra.AAC.1